MSAKCCGSCGRWDSSVDPDGPQGKCLVMSMLTEAINGHKCRVFVKRGFKADQLPRIPHPVLEPLKPGDLVMEAWTRRGMPEAFEYEDTTYDWSCFAHDEVGLCGCSQPEIAAELLIKVLEWFEWPEDGKRSYTALGEFLPNGPLRELVFHWLDDRGWTEHGTCLPGWRTQAGDRALTILKRFVELEREDYDGQLV